MKPLAEFSIRSTSRDGLSADCTLCTRAYTAAWRSAHPGYKPPDAGDRPRSASAELRKLTRKSLVAEQKLAEARAAKRRVAAEHKALAAEVLAPALAALKAAVTALETLIGSPPAPTTKIRAANGIPAKAVPSASPPSIREIKAIMAEHGVGRGEAKRIQEAEIIARAEWRPSITTH